MGILASARTEVRAWCTGRMWPGRALLLVFFAYLGIRFLIDPNRACIFNAINLGIHEAGHLLFRWTDLEFLGVAAGTLFQLAAPLVAAFMFARQPDHFAVAVCGCWLSTNLYSVATYAGDARALALPLVSVGVVDNVIHDWNYMLSRLGMLGWDTTIATLLRVAAFAAMWGSIAGGSWLLYLMGTVREGSDDAPRRIARPVWSPHRMARGDDYAPAETAGDRTGTRSR